MLANRKPFHENEIDPQQLLLKGIESNDIDMVQNALSEGADFNKINKYGQSPYRFATDSKQNPEIVKVLIIAGADVNDQSQSSRFTPLHEAAYKCNLPLMSVLIKLGADVDKQSLNGMTPLHCVCDNQSLCRKEEAMIEAIEYLVKNGAKLDITDRDGNTPLRWAAYWGRRDVAKYLIKLGSNFQTTRRFINPSPISFGNKNVGGMIASILEEIGNSEDDKTCTLSNTTKL